MAARRTGGGGPVPRGSGTRGAVPGAVGPSVPYVAPAGGAGCGGGSKGTDGDAAWRAGVWSAPPPPFCSEQGACCTPGFICDVLLKEQRRICY